jgi:hypothetical protein
LNVKSILKGEVMSRRAKENRKRKKEKAANVEGNCRPMVGPYADWQGRIQDGPVIDMQPRRGGFAAQMAALAVMSMAGGFMADLEKPRKWRK